MQYFSLTQFKRFYITFYTIISALVLNKGVLVDASTSFATNNITTYSMDRRGLKDLMHKLSSTHNKEKVSIVLLYRMGCGYCRFFSGTYKRLAKEYKELGVSFYAMQFSDDQSKRGRQKTSFSEGYAVQVNTFPCLIIYKGREKIVVIQGSQEDRTLDSLRITLNGILGRA